MKSTSSLSRTSGQFPIQLVVVVLLAWTTLTILPGCTSDDDGPIQPTSFALLLTNKTPRDYNVYQRPSSAGDVFGKVGVAPSGSTYRINPLTPGTNYVFRLLRDGNTVDQFDFENNVNSTGSDVAWEVK
ncbi:MAG: hypothetical protein WBQ23_09610 [Bacteroidota bacterium]